MSSRKNSSPIGLPAELYTPEAIAAASYDELDWLLVETCEFDPDGRSDGYKAVRAEMERRDAAGIGKTREG